MDHPDMTNMPIYQTPSDLSWQDPLGNESFENAYSLPHYPLTPEPQVPDTRDWSPSALGTWDELVHTTEPEANRRARTHFHGPSASGLCRSSPTPSSNISSTELQRVFDSLMDQIDWLEVAEKVAKNRAPSVYYDAIEKILLAHIYQLVKVEGEGDDATKFENGNGDKGGLYAHEGDEHEDSSEAPWESEDEGGQGDEDSVDYDDEDMEGDDEEEYDEEEYDEEEYDEEEYDEEEYDEEEYDEEEYDEEEYDEEEYDEMDEDECEEDNKYSGV